MEFFEKKISHLIEDQFPDFYKEEGPIFIEFVKKYYEWLESDGQMIYHSRRLLEYGDIDETTDNFLIHFKNKYLSSIQFDTATNTRQLVKHSLDLYRSKGTSQSIDLFFKEVFGKPAEVYFPADDLFRLSSAEWIIPIYLEVSYEENLKRFIGYQIIGLESNATAYVEKYIRKKINGRYIEIFSITNITGNFYTGEKFTTSTTSNLESAIDFNHPTELIGPTIIGSLTTLDIINGGENYSIGDIVDIYADSGIQGKARVAGVGNTVGVVEFNLNDGGWGYNSNSTLIISNNVLKISDLVIGSNNNSNGTYNQFETIVQPLANVSYIDLAGETFANGDFLYRYDPDTADIISEARILSVLPATNTTGSMVISMYADRFNPAAKLETENSFDIVTERGLVIGAESIEWADTHLYHDEANAAFDFAVLDETSNSIIGIQQSTFYKHYRLAGQNNSLLLFEDAAGFALEDEVSSAVISSFDDISAVANVMLSSSNNNLYITGAGGTKFIAGEEVYQNNESATEIANATIESITYSGLNATIKVIDISGAFTKSLTLDSRLTTANGVVSNLNLDVAVYQVENTFLSTNNNIIIGLYSNTYGEVQPPIAGAGADISISNTFLYNQSVNIATDYIYDYLLVDIANSDWGFSTQANLNTIIVNAFSYDMYTYGTVSSITLTGSGVGYDNIPYIILLEPSIIPFEKRDFVVNISNTTSLFLVGEVVQQSGNNKGIVKSGSNSSVLYLKRITYDDTFDETFSLVTEAGNYLSEETSVLPIHSEQEATLFGVQTGAIANILSYQEDTMSAISGFNANISTSVTTSVGSISNLEVVDSGYGYYQDEPVTFYSNTNASVGAGLSNLGNHGSGTGYYKRNDSLLSSNKYLQDSFYYQEFSYEIRSAITLEKYKDMLKNILHIAGTKSFSRYVSKSNINIGKTAKTAVVTIEWAIF